MKQYQLHISRIIRFLICTASILLSQYALAINDNIRFESVRIDGELSQQSITAIFQDSKGYMWFGTQEGLNRYDGINFKTYQPEYDDPNSLSSAWIYSITEDNQGNLWVGTNAGVNVFNEKQNRFTRYTVNNTAHAINDNVVRVVHKAHNGSIWLATRNGLNQYFDNKKQFKQYNFSDYKGVNATDVYAVAEDSNGSLWLGTKDHGLLKFDPETGDLSIVAAEFNTPNGLANIGIRSLYFDDEQTLWIGTIEAGLYHVDVTQGSNETVSKAITRAKHFTPNTVISISQDSHNTLWFGTGKGLYYKNKNATEFNSLIYSFNDVGNLANSQISSLYLNSSGVFWVGTIEGLNKWNTRTRQFAHYFKSGAPNRSISANTITMLGSNGKGLVFVGSPNGVDIINSASGVITSLPIKTATQSGLKEKRVVGFSYVSEKELWFGYITGGATQYNPTNNTYVHFGHDINDATSIVNAGVTDILSTKDGAVWFATFGGGVSRYNRKTNNFTNFAHDPSDINTLSSNNVLTLLESNDGSVWVGTWGAGISILTPATGIVTIIQHEENDESGLGSNQIVTMLLDSQDNTWIGTHGAGLRILSAENKDNGTFIFDRLDSKNGMPNNVVYGLLEDDDGDIWASSNKGIVKINQQTRDLTIFTEAQGLQGNEFNSGAYMKDENGDLYFGGVNGVTAFNPRNVVSNPEKPNIEFTNFQRFNHFENIANAINEDGLIEVDYTDYFIGFEFAAMDFASPKNNQYRYKLVDFDKDWIDIRNTPRATYTNLPSGQYKFQVAASNSDGVWNTKSIGLLVNPAPWLSWWAYTLYSVLAIIISCLIYRAFKRKSQIRQQYQIDLQEEVSIRTAELQKANEQMHIFSITDQLTNLHNRRYLAEVMSVRLDDIVQRFNQATREETMMLQGGPRLIAIMFDLDGFKPINDNYGHDAGDKVIIQVANIIKKECRKEDVVVRWGGDEYIVVAEVDSLDEGCRFAERVRSAIMNHEFDLGLPDKLHLSSSLGFAMYPFYHKAPLAITWDQVHLLADQALYKSKGAGGNTWTGIIQVDRELPVSTVNSLVPNVDEALEQNAIALVERQTYQPLSLATTNNQSQSICDRLCN